MFIIIETPTENLTILVFDNFSPSGIVEKENNIVYFHKVLLVQLLDQKNHYNLLLTIP